MISNQTISNVSGVARISSTFGIFLFHTLGLHGIYNKNIDFICITIFCALSGLYIPEKTDQFWIKKKFINIMLPYWIIIIPIIIINRIVSYKETSIAKDVFTIFGLNLFIKNPVYVICWYITFILLLYSSAYIINTQKTNTDTVATIIFSSIIFISINKFFYFIIFLLFYLIRISFNKYIEKDTLKYNFIQKAQPLCYDFFLVHGACVLVTFITFNNIYATFIIGLTLSFLSSILLQHIAKKLISYSPLTPLKRNP